MRIRNVAAASMLAGLALSALGAGQASAVQFIGPTPDGLQNGVHAQILLTHDETVALDNSPIPDLIDRHGPKTSGWVDYESRLPEVAPGWVKADFADIVGEAADSPNGWMQLLIVDPAIWHGAPLGFDQNLR